MPNFLDIIMRRYPEDLPGCLDKLSPEEEDRILKDTGLLYGIPVARINGRLFTTVKAIAVLFEYSHISGALYIIRKYRIPLVKTGALDKETLLSIQDKFKFKGPGHTSIMLTTGKAALALYKSRHIKRRSRRAR
jgi:hypothetical protein